MKDTLDPPIRDRVFHGNVSVVAYDHSEEKIFIKYHDNDVENMTRLEWLNQDDREAIVNILRKEYAHLCI